MEEIVLDTYGETLQELLKGLRIKKGLSQDQVFQECRVDVSKHEARNCVPKTSAIIKLCKLYGIRFAGFWVVFDEYENGRISLPKALEILDQWSNHNPTLQIAVEMIIKNQDAV